MYFRLLLIIAGDVETNPGPRTKKASAEKKRKQNRNYKRTQRNKEDEKSKKERLEREKVNKNLKRKLQTADESSERKLMDKVLKAKRKKVELPEQTAKRKLANKALKDKTRKTEAPEQKLVRLQAQKVRTTANRKLETKEQTVERIHAQKVRTSTKRKLETVEQTALRRKVQRANAEQYTKLLTQQQKAELKEKKRVRMAQSRNNTNDISKITSLFLEKIKFGPDFVCCCCHRMMYRQNVQLFYNRKYPKLSNEQFRTILEPYIYTSVDGNTWICVTCNRSLSRGKMPRQAKANELELDQVPDTLAELNEIEIRLLSLRIPFMKIVALPRGKQKAIHGPAVNIPTKLDAICNLLPRLPDEAELLPMKLKRKLSYKSHYMYDSIHPQKMIAALQWLTENNPLYSQIELNENWTNQWNKSDPELWHAVTGFAPSNYIHEGSEIETQVHEVPATNTAVKIYVDSPVQDSFIHLEQLCTEEGYSVENVPGDGNCFYHAIAKQLEHAGVQCQYHRNGVLLRTDLVHYLETHPRGTQGQLPYRDFLANREVQGDSERETAQDQYVESVSNEQDRLELRWQRYLQDMEEGSWADHIAVQGMADMLHVSIRIVATANPYTMIRPTDGIVNGMLHLGLIGQLHYVSLIRIAMDGIIEVLQDKKLPDVVQDQHVEKILYMIQLKTLNNILVE